MAYGPVVLLTIYQDMKVFDYLEIKKISEELKLSFKLVLEIGEECWMKIKEFTVYRLIKSEDLNHHGTLFAGRCAEWFVEAGFIAAADVSFPNNTVCLKIHGMTFTKAVHRGDTIKFTSKVIWVGRSRLVSYVKVSTKDGEFLVDGFITFVHVDNEGHSEPHGISQIEPQTEEDKKNHELAQHVV